MNPLIILGITLVGLIAINLWWRGESRRRSMPCPTWMSGLVEGSLMDRVLGTKTTLDRIGSRAGQRVLEVGPGPGRLLIPSAQRVQPGGQVVGLDIQPGMIERLKARAARAGVSNLTPILGDATQPHFPPDSFDVIYFCTVLGEIPDRAGALHQCHSALRTGGRLSITELFPDPHYQSRATVQQLAGAAGFQLEQLHGSWYFFTANFSKA